MDFSGEISIAIAISSPAVLRIGVSGIRINQRSFWKDSDESKNDSGRGLSAYYAKYSYLYSHINRNIGLNHVGAVCEADHAPYSVLMMRYEL